MLKCFPEEILEKFNFKAPMHVNLHVDLDLAVELIFKDLKPWML